VTAFVRITAPLRGRYQFWLFQYNTGQPILYSAMLLRRALRNVREETDPNGQDAALPRMVIIGHSQGGLLTKLMSISSGNRFWNLSLCIHRRMEARHPYRNYYQYTRRRVKHDGSHP
jgi:hypothetical protein